MISLRPISKDKLLLKKYHKGKRSASLPPIHLSVMSTPAKFVSSPSSNPEECFVFEKSDTRAKDEVTESEDKTSTGKSFESESENEDSDTFDEDTSSVNLYNDINKQEKCKEFYEKIESYITRFRIMTDQIIHSELAVNNVDCSTESNPQLVEGKSHSSRRRRSILHYDVLLQSGVYSDTKQKREQARMVTSSNNGESNDSQEVGATDSSLSATKSSVDKAAKSEPMGPENKVALVEKVEVKLTEKEGPDDLIDPTEAALRTEIVNLRKTRDYLVDQRRALDCKLNEEKIYTKEEEKQFLKIDEAIDAIDSAMEFKNELICGHKGVEKTNGMEKSDEMLIDRLMNLSELEMRSLLCKYFNKVVDLRETGRRMEQQMAEQDRQMETQSWKIQALGNALQQIRIESERRLVMVHREHEEKLHLVLRHYGGDTSGSSSVNNEVHSDNPCIGEAPLVEYQDKSKRDHSTPANAISIPQQNIKKLQGSFTHTTKVTRKKNKLIIQQERSKKK